MLSIEVFYWDGKPDPSGEYLVWDCDDNKPLPGWYWWVCQPGCLPDSDPYGPFKTRTEAEQHANEVVETS